MLCSDVRGDPINFQFHNQLENTNKQSKGQCIPRKTDDDMNTDDSVNYSSSAVFCVVDS